MLSIPPYFSASWDQIATIQMIDKNGTPYLKIVLESKETTEIPGLSQEEVMQIFKAHQEYLSNSKTKKETSNPFDLFSSMKLDGMGDLSKLSLLMQHDPSQSSSDDLPAEMLEKFKQFSGQMSSLLSGLDIPKAEPHCNCPHCQVMRAVHSSDESSTNEKEEEVTEEELKFNDWKVELAEKGNEKLYNVINPINPNERYQVYLGNPICCTCGSSKCEHIKAVLES